MRAGSLVQGPSFLLAPILAVLAVATGALAHPGTVAADGCHACRHGCGPFGLAAGQRHCHPERLQEQQERRGGSAKLARAEARIGRAGGDAREFETERARILKVSDGDTFQVEAASGKDKVRVLGIDCPESSHNAKCERNGRQGRDSCDVQVPRGLAAKRRAIELLADATVTLEGPFSRDPFGRRLAYVRLPDGQDFGLLMIREGRCEDFGWKYPHPRSGAYRNAGPGVRAPDASSRP